MAKKDKVELTASEKAEAKALHEKRCKEIQTNHNETRRFVQQKFRGNPEPLWLDNKGRG